MPKKTVEAAAKEGSAAVAAAAGGVGLSEAVRQGLRVTLAFLTLYYLFLFAQATMKRKLRAHYAKHEKKVPRRA